MGWVSQNQIKRAREVAAIDYILKYESNNIKRFGKEYRFLDHNSLSVGDNGWFWHSKGIGGWSALSYLTKARDYGLVDAVCKLLSENPQDCSGANRTDIQAEPISQSKTKESNKSSFKLPTQNSNNNRTKAYLLSRGIDKDLILDCINRGDLYENRIYHSCVFIGKDENDKAKYATMRSTTTSYMGDAEGSDKRYGFLLPPDDLNTHEVAVFESPIDALSHQTLCKNGYIPYFNGWRLSLGGSSTLSFEHFLLQHPEINHCVICTDNDKAGEKTATKINSIPGITTERIYPSPDCKDWNATLMEIQREERIKNTSRTGKEPSL